MKLLEVIGVVFVTLIIEQCHGSDILFWMAIGSRSHFSSWNPLVQELAKRGHDITLVTPLKHDNLAKFPNVQHYQVKDFLEELIAEHTHKGNIFEDDYSLSPPPLHLVSGSSVKANEWILNQPDFKERVLDKKFDVTVINPFILDMGVYLSKEVFNSSTMYFCPTFRFPMLDMSVGNPTNPAYIPIELFGFSEEMSFPERLINTAAWFALPIVYEYIMAPGIDELIQREFKLENSPQIGKMLYEPDFLMMTNHYLFESNFPVNPNTAWVGGIQCDKSKSLPKDLENWVQGADKGVILLSFGSVLKASDLPDDKLAMFLGAFEKLSGYRILWKWEKEDMAGKPDNVMLSKWLPQPDILGHNKTKLFISHMGVNSFVETVYHGIPVLAMPIMNDQFANSKMAIRMGQGKELLFKDLTEDNLYNSLLSVLNDDAITLKAQTHKDILQNPLVSPLETAVYHTEHLAKYPHAPLLKPKYKEMPLYQFALLDVITFVTAVFFLLLLILWMLIKLTFYCCCGKGKKKTSREKTE